MPGMRTSAALALVLLAACSDDAAHTNNPTDGDTGTPDAPGQLPDPGCEVPIATLRAYLDQGAYKQFPVEPAVHAGTGPHGGNVRTYLTPALDASLKAGVTEHPRCAAAVKELYGGGTITVTGWAVSVKASETSNNGANWYWYELTSTRPGSTPGFAGYGLSLCTSCHRGGKDYVLTPTLP